MNNCENRFFCSIAPFLGLTSQACRVGRENSEEKKRFRPCNLKPCLGFFRYNSKEFEGRTKTNSSTSFAYESFSFIFPCEGRESTSNPKVFPFLASTKKSNLPFRMLFPCKGSSKTVCSGTIFAMASSFRKWIRYNSCKVTRWNSLVASFPFNGSIRIPCYTNRNLVLGKAFLTSFWNCFKVLRSASTKRWLEKRSMASTNNFLVLMRTSQKKRSNKTL